jgi:hypothetical protein
MTFYYWLVLAMLWVPISLLTGLALVACWHVTHRGDDL